VVCFLALAIAGLSWQDPHVVRGAYVAMHLITWLVIVPFSVAALLTGLIDSLGTSWGLWRHYWVVTKLMLTVVATLLLMLHTQPIDHVAAVAAQTDLFPADLRQVRVQLVGDAAAALFVLTVTTALSVYKPWGLTPYGIRKQAELVEGWKPPVSGRPVSPGRWVLFAIAGLLALVALLHLLGLGLHGH
jgi:hypothetical protein